MVYNREKQTLISTYKYDSKDLCKALQMTNLLVIEVKLEVFRVSIGSYQVNRII